MSLLVAGMAVGAFLMWLSIPAAVDGEMTANQAESGLPAREGATGRQTRQKTTGITGEMDRRARGEHFREAGAAAARKNLQQALAGAEAMESKQDQLDFYRGIYAEWAGDDPEGALAYAQTNFPAGKLQGDTVGLAMNKWAQAHPREAWLWAEQNLSGPLKERALTDLVMGWTRRSPDEAADWLANTGLTSQPLFNALPGTWAENDPVAAAAWVAELPSGKAKETAQIAVASTLAANSPEEAAALYSKELADGEHLNLTISITDIWATTDPAATAEWLSGLPDGASKAEAAATLATVWAASDIKAAVAWSEGLSDESMRQQVISHLGTTWGAIEPHAALEWLNSLPAEIAGDGVTGAFYSWAGTDPIGLQEWIDQVPADATSDRARQSLGDVLSESNLPDALDVALGMQSPAVRDNSVARYFNEWRKRDDASAQDWLDASWGGLPTGTQQAISKVQTKRVEPK